MNHDGFEKLLLEVSKGFLISATLSSLKDKASTLPIKVVMRPVKMQQKIMVQISEHFKQNVMHKNVSFKEASKFIAMAMLSYKQGIFKLKTHEFHLLNNKDNQMTVLQREIKEKNLPILDHNPAKKYILSEGSLVPFLMHLGIMNQEGKVYPKKYDKFRQINRFLEMIRDVLAYLPKDRPIRIIDFGCGKAYLTFALHYFLHEIQGFDLDVVGLDLKKEVVNSCQEIADKLILKGLKFIASDINAYETRGEIDMMISLHACDTATDAALAKSIAWKAKVILCVPCCQHELNGQIKSEALKPLLKYGILKERFSALATDAIRAEALALQGYDVDILEFIDMEHTPKNLLIRACRNEKKANSNDNRQTLRLNTYLEFKEFLNADLALDRLLESLSYKL